MSLSELEELIKAHDMTFLFSDNDFLFAEGLKERNHIRECAKNFPFEQVSRIWDKYVDLYVEEDYRKFYYWNMW